MGNTPNWVVQFIECHIYESVNNNTPIQHQTNICTNAGLCYDDIIKWKHFPHYWPICGGNSPVIGEFPAQRPVTRSFGVFFDLRLYKRLSKQS